MKNKRIASQKISRRKKVLKKVIIFYAVSILILLGFYLSTVLTKNPQFLVRDIQEKYSQVLGTATMNISLRVVGPPGKPVGNASAHCSSDNAYVQISWNSTSDTDDYDIYRDSLPLATSITETSYQDNAVSENTTYTYQIIANGPMGNTPSDSFTVTTGECAVTTQVTCTIQTLNGKQISSYHDTPALTDQTPTIAGNTNTANAHLTILITGKTLAVANFDANINGYWSWTTPKLKHGTYLASVIAIDPANPARQGSDYLIFKIKEEEKDEEKDEEKIEIPIIPSKEIPKPEIIPPEETEKIEIPLEISTEVKNPGKKLTANDKLDLATKLIHHNENLKNFTLIYEIFDEKGNLVKTDTEKIISSENETLKKTINLPSLAKTGRYKILTRAEYDGFNISSEDYFWLIEKPILDLGGGFVYTLSDLMSKISWLVLILLLILILFILLFIIENYLSKQALFHITEDFLRKRGFFGRRKGVLK